MKTKTTESKSRTTGVAEACVLSLALAACAGPNGAAQDAGPSSEEAGGSVANVGTDAESSFSPDSSDGANFSPDSTGGAQGTDGGLDPNAPPGTNFDLAIWELQEPVGSPGDPTTIGNKQLEAGYEDTYFATDPTDGAMTFFDPEDGVTTADSSYPRSELRELAADGSEANWAPAGTNMLSATVEVVGVPDHVCVGQIHIGSPLPDSGVASSTKPLLELFYYANGAISVAIEQTPAGGNEVQTSLATAALGTRFTYAITLDGASAAGATIGITIDGATATFPMPAGFEGYGEYFKAGDYDQSAGDAGTGATVKFYALSVAHAP